MLAGMPAVGDSSSLCLPVCRRDNIMPAWIPKEGREAYPGRLGCATVAANRPPLLPRRAPREHQGQVAWDEESHW